MTDQDPPEGDTARRADGGGADAPTADSAGTGTSVGLDDRRPAPTEVGDRPTGLRETVVRYQVPLALVGLVVVLRPLLAHPLVLDYGQIASTMLIWMLFVAAVNFLFGFAGLLSFGHAMFLGFGVYGAAIGVARFDLPYLVAAPVGIVVAGLVAYVMGRFIVQKGEIYFALLTLAFSKAVEFVVNRDPAGLTGGSNGLSRGTLPAWIESYRGQTFVELPGITLDWYWLVSGVFLVAMLALWQVLRSPFGRVLIAVRDNERLARAMGVDVRRYRIAAFVGSGLLAGLAGALLSVNNHGAGIEDLSVVTSGDAVLMAILGGANFYAGPIAGTFVWMFAEEYLTDLSGVFTYWHFFLGALIVVIVVVSPRDGIWGAVRTAARRLRARVADDDGGRSQ